MSEEVKTASLMGLEFVIEVNNTTNCLLHSLYVVASEMICLMYKPINILRIFEHKLVHVIFSQRSESIDH